ncbi:MAG TPA: hypothetical protein PLL39_15915 [Rhodocyclaceae bacterium]|nr:hypothetical protein [Rhodocyclaceae bacterium]
MTTITRTAPATQTVRAAVAGLLALGLAAGAMPAPLETEAFIPSGEPT